MVATVPEESLASLSRMRLRQLVQRHSKAGPRYTSYPTAAEFGPLDAETYEARLAKARLDVDEPWSAYVHVPFCTQRCSFCACSVVASPEHDRVAEPYVDRLVREIQLVSRRLGARRRLAQLHLGGGTPTYLAPELLARVFAAIAREFVDDPAGCEWSIELDARATTPAHVELFGELGIDRVSLGVQDLDPAVQAAIGRVQSYERIREVAQACREVGVRGINLDLVYGLPRQTEASMRRTIEGVLDIAPDRIALYGYAHVPWLPGRGNQRAIPQADLPDPNARLELFLSAREQLLAAGYQAIGMDHFACPDDPLARADAAGTLRRNFMGYAVAAGRDLLGFGVTSIGEVAGAYVQNHTKLVHWQTAIDRGELPVARGIVRTPEDSLRAALIEQLMCSHRVDKPALARRFGIDFDEHFARELDELAAPEFDELVRMSPDALEVTPTGRLFVRNLAMVFDERLPKLGQGHVAPRFSATV